MKASFMLILASLAATRLFLKPKIPLMMADVSKVGSCGICGI